MKLIIGLGNPGSKYENTRHNCGFQVIDRLERKLNVTCNNSKFEGLYGKVKYKGEDIVLLKPQTYMNESGRSVRKIMDFFKINKEDIIVICDDLDLPCGKVRLRKKGSAGGHNGLKSVIAHVGGQDFKRVKIGIDRDKYIPVIDWVLGRFTPMQQPLVNEAFDKAADAVMMSLDKGFDYTMNQFN